MHIFEWYDFLAIYFLSILSLTGLIFGSRLIFNSGVKMISELSMKWLGILMCACVFILVSFASWLVTMMILFSAGSSNLNIMPTWPNEGDMEDSSKTLIHSHIVLATKQLVCYNNLY